jgi:hypothetical protein
VNEGHKVIGVRYGRVPALRWIIIRIVVSPAISNCPIFFAERADLVRPVPTIAQGSMDKDHRHSSALLNVVENNAMPDINGLDSRRSSRLRLCQTIGNEQACNKNGENDSAL